MAKRTKGELQVQTESEKLHGDPLDHAASDSARADTERKANREGERQPSADTSVEDRQDELESQTND